MGDRMIGGIIFMFVLLTGLVMPWVNHSRIGNLRRDLAELQDMLDRLMRQKKEAVTVAPPVPEPAPVYVPPAPPAPVVAPTPAREDFAAEHAVPGLRAVPAAAQTESGNFEQQFGGRLFVWLGGVALALAGFFMVKYSIESGLLTEKVRVILGLLFGGALLGAGAIVRRYPGLADGTRISQALAGAGIADLYGCLFAATTLYHLMPPWLGFVGMAAVTGMTLVLSLRYGAPIAALGLIGGYVTPMLIEGEPNAPLLFGYLFLVFGSLAAVIRRQNWWWLSIPATLVAFLWVAGWLVGGSGAVDGRWLALFLLGISAVVVLATRDQPGGDALSLPSWLRCIAFGGSLLLLAAVTGTAQFGLFEWYMFGLFSLGAMALAWFDGRTYGYAPWLAMGANIVTLAAWNHADPSVLTITLAIFGFMFAAGAYLSVARAKNAVSWAGLSAAAALAYYLLAFVKLQNTLPQTLGVPALSADQVWAIMAFALAIFFIAATSKLFVLQGDQARRQALQSIFAVAASSFMFLGFAILLHQDYLAFAMAGEVLTISWIGTKVDIPALRPIALGLAAIFGTLLIPETGALFSSPFDDISGYTDPRFLPLHTVPYTLFRYGLPALMFAGASRLLRTGRDDTFVAVLELGAIALFSMMSYHLLAAGFGGHDGETAFASRGLFTDAVLLLAFASLYTSRHYKRPAIAWGGLLLCGLAVARIAGYDLLIHDPLWSNEMVGAWKVANSLALAYGLPALLIVFIGNELKLAGHAGLARTGKMIALALAFIFVSFNVRQFYHGAYLDGGAMTDAEVYTYSAAWLAMGIALLLAGTLRQDSMLRLASLLIMLLTVGKVFLYDASALTGLWRVFSFFGLGLGLLGLSWYYSRFVFNMKKRGSA